MGCKCINSSSEKKTELNPQIISSKQLLLNNNNNSKKNDIEEVAKEDTEEEHMKKYSNYPSEMITIINKIRQNPKSYADIIEESINNIVIENNNVEINKPKIIYKEKIKVALTRGESAFREAANELRNLTPIPPLEFKEEICIPLPDNIDDFKDANYLRNKVQEILGNKIKINVFYKELVKLPEVSALLMVVDDNGKNSGKKRKAILNKKFKYIGITYKFIGKTFISYFSFSK